MQGRTPRDAVHVLNDAKALEEAGAYAVVLEVVPAALAKLVTERLTIPTIGIGAGPYCSGQVQVMHDMLGMDESFTPKHARRFMEGAAAMRDAFVAYREAVQAATFPAEEESFFLDAVNRVRPEATLHLPVFEQAHEGFDAELVMLRAEAEADPD